MPSYISKEEQVRDLISMTLEKGLIILRVRIICISWWYRYMSIADILFIGKLHSEIAYVMTGFTMKSNIPDRLL
jgi:hypothetical protein